MVFTLSQATHHNRPALIPAAISSSNDLMKTLLLAVMHCLHFHLQRKLLYCWHLSFSSLVFFSIVAVVCASFQMTWFWWRRRWKLFQKLHLIFFIETIYYYHIRKTVPPSLPVQKVPSDSCTTVVFFSSVIRQSPALAELTALYVGRSWTLWKEPPVMLWLEESVKAVLRRVDTKDPLVEDSQSK